MSLPDQTSPPPRSVMLLLALGMAALGLVMLLHGLGFISAQWLRPNPKVPPAIFAMIGAILLLGAWLTLGKLISLPKRAINAAGFSLMALSIAVMHWLVFFSKGGSCSGGMAGLGLSLPLSFCGIVMGGAVILLDAILLLVGLATLRSHRRSQMRR